MPGVTEVGGGHGTVTDLERLPLDCGSWTLFYENGLGAEDWSAKVAWICATCSLGSPHAHDDSSDELTPVRSFGLAGPKQRIVELLSTWEAAGAGRIVHSEP